MLGGFGMTTPDDIIDEILRAEGSQFTNDPADSGGPTKYGITQAALSTHRGAWATPAEVAALTEAEARLIYRRRYWHDTKIDMISAVSPVIGAEVMDTGVNAGPPTAIRMLQRALNALNNRGALFPDLVVDGKAGPATANALRMYLAQRGADGERVLFVVLNGLQVEHYTALVERREKDERFYYGWVRERAAAQL